MSVEEVEEHNRESVELRKLLDDVTAKNDSQRHHQKVLHADIIRRLTDVRKLFCVCLCVRVCVSACTCACTCAH